MVEITEITLVCLENVENEFTCFRKCRKLMSILDIIEITEITLVCLENVENKFICFRNYRKLMYLF
jgi:hypothetical protein